MKREGMKRKRRAMRRKRHQEGQGGPESLQRTVIVVVAGFSKILLVIRMNIKVHHIPLTHGWRADPSWASTSPVPADSTHNDAEVELKMEPWDGPADALSWRMQIQLKNFRTWNPVGTATTCRQGVVCASLSSSSPRGFLSYLNT